MLEPVSDEESQCGEEDAEDMESVTMSEAPDSMKYDKEMDIEEERQALQNIKGMPIGSDCCPATMPKLQVPEWIRCSLTKLIRPWTRRPESGFKSTEV
jgi:hypothetical protein